MRGDRKRGGEDWCQSGTTKGEVKGGCRVKERRRGAAGKGGSHQREENIGCFRLEERKEPSLIWGGLQVLVSD